MSRSALERMTGSPEYVHIDGTAYKLSPITPEDFADVRALMRSQVQDPLDAILERIRSEQIPRHLHELAFKEGLRLQESCYSFSSTEGREWVNSPPGMAAFLWVTLRRMHPEVTYERALQMIQQLNVNIADSLMRKIDAVSGFSDKDVASNPTSPKPKSQRPKTPARRNK